MLENLLGPYLGHNFVAIVVEDLALLALGIVPSCSPVQYQRKLINQT